MKLQDLVDGVRFSYNNLLYEYRKDQLEYDGSLWNIGKVTGTRRQLYNVHLLTPSGFTLAGKGETWAFSKMRKEGFEYRIYTPMGMQVAAITAMDDTAFQKALETTTLPGFVGNIIRVTTKCPGSTYPVALDTSVIDIKKQQP